MMPKANLPLVSIITINWNSTQVTGDLLRSLNEHGTYPNMEVIVVDNGSKEDPTATLTAIYPRVKVILTNKNLGFSGGNNAGIEQARGDYFFLVNNDTEFTPQLIEGLLSVFDTYPDAGLVCPKFHFYFNKGTIEYAGSNAINIFTGRNTTIGSHEKDHGQYNKINTTSYAHGGAMMVSRKVVETVGKMPEQFFLYYEELDWSEQIRRNGYKIYFQPASLIYHKESMTTGKQSPLKTFYLTRNRILFMQRNVSKLSYVFFLGFFACFTVPKNTGLFLVKGQREHLRSFWRGIAWHFGKKTNPV